MSYLHCIAPYLFVRYPTVVFMEGLLEVGATAVRAEPTQITRCVCRAPCWVLNRHGSFFCSAMHADGRPLTDMDMVVVYIKQTE